MKTTTQSEAGFSLLELTASMAILLVVCGAALSALGAFQKSYGSTLLRSDMHAGVRSATELLAQEIGQAGSVPATQTTLGAAVTALSTAQVVTVGSSAGMYVGEKLQIDTGATQETVTITALSYTLNTITAVFTQAHASGVLVQAIGVFPQGILSSSTGTQLQMFGDINADGTLQFVEYNCDTTAGTLTRSITPVIGSTAKNTPVVLVQNLIANPGGTSCFQYTWTTSGTYTIATSVSLTLTTQTAKPDPQTGVYATMTKSFLNLDPRNLIDGLDLANNSMTNRLQPTPSNLPLP